MTVKVKRIGGSVAVLIPRAMARELNLVAGAEMDVEASGQGVLLFQRRSSPRVRQPLKALLAGVRRAAYQRQTARLGDTGVVGREVW